MNTMHTVSADTMIAHAKALAAITSEALTTVTNTALKAKEEWTGAPIALYIAMAQTYSAEQLESFPIIDSESGNNPDIVKVPSEKKGGKPKDVSFYVVWSDNTPIGAAICSEIAHLKTLDNKEADHTVVPADLRKLSSHERAVRLKYLTARRGSIRNAYKNAIKLMHQFQAVNELDNCEATLIPGVTQGTYENTILVRSTVEGRETMDYEHYNISQFLRLDAGKAAEKEGTLNDLKDTLKRAKPPANVPGSEGAAAAQVIKTVDTYGVRMGDVNTFMSEVWSAPADYGNFLDKLGKDDLALLNTFDVYFMLKDVAAMDELGNKYAALKEAANKVAKAA